MSTHPIPIRSIVAALLLAIGLAAAGGFAARGMIKFRTQDRFVTVKGFAEKIVDADLVVWPLTYTVSGHTLAEVQTRLDTDTETIRKFFFDAGFEDKEIVIAPPKLEDRWVYAANSDPPAERFLNNGTAILRTRRVSQAIEALRRSSELMSRGVRINVDYVGDGYSGSPEFEYTRLNDIKPQLIAEATANARKSAAQFAKDSGSRLGSIRTAHQGQVTIENRDRGSPQIKKVRVVTTVEYFLRD